MSWCSPHYGACFCTSRHAPYPIIAAPMDQQGPSSGPPPLEKGRAPGGKIANSLVALSSAAVLTVYAAGYLRTRSAAARFAVVEAADGRTSAPVAGPPALAEPPREFVDTAAPAKTTSAVPASPVPKSGASVGPSGVASSEAALAPIADSTASTPVPAPSEEPAPQPAAT